MCFFKQKTAYELRISDWSSDVCSSDLGIDIVAAPGQRDRQAVVLIGDAEAVANRFPAVPAAQRVVPHARQLDDGRTEHRPVAREGDPAAGAAFLAILKLLGQAGGVAVEARMAEHGLEIGRASCREKGCQY